VVGPTASGKTALGIAFAQARNGVVINADASQISTDLDILSARPSQAEMTQAEHRLFGVVDGAASCSAGDWSAMAKREIADVTASGRVPILVGGTGMYVRTLLEGIAPVPEIDADIRAEIRATQVAENYAALASLDPVMAARLRPSDTTRIARALEVIRSTGRSLAEWQQEKVGGIADDYAVEGHRLLPPRDWLRARCDLRFSQMMDAGAEAEVTTLLARGLHPDLPVMRAIGVPEIAALLRGELSREDAIILGQAATRQYAKRQYTWFRNQSPESWKRHEAALNTQIIADIVI
jgi:tRNA dimethylallyltransferase